MRIAVIVHVFYIELWDSLSTCIDNLKSVADVDLFVSTTTDDVAFKNRVTAKYPDADFRIVENKGYDIAPFFKMLNAVDVNSYDYVVKLHTKRDLACWINYLPFPPKRWRRRLLWFCSSAKEARQSIQYLERHSDVGMLSHPSLIVGRGDFMESEDIKSRADEKVREMGLFPARRQFVAGTMFIARAKCFAKIRSVVSQNEFEQIDCEAKMTNVRHNSNAAHVYERVLGYMMTAQGFRIVDRRGMVSVYDVLYWIRMPMFYVLQLLYRCTLKVFICRG